MIGTGFMKWKPHTRCGLDVAAASLVIEMDDVLLARMAWTGVTRSRCSKTLFLTASLSVTASTTKSASRMASKPGSRRTRPTASSACCDDMEPFFTKRPRERLIEARPWSKASRVRSERMTCIPRVAQTWAMPLPIWPLPTTPMTWGRWL